jgi:hypothetical protein
VKEDFFLRTKRSFLVLWVMGVVADNPHDPKDQKFLRRFFQKAAAFLMR